MSLGDLYYQPENLWVGSRAIKELKQRTKVKGIRQWLARQALWQVHLTAPKRVYYPHYNVTEVNKIHQADLMYLPHDKVYQNTYKYVVNVIDVASRYKASRPLRTKKASDVRFALEDIYKSEPLIFPKEFHCDNGSEFKAQVNTLLKEHDVKVKRVTTKYHHRFTAFVERFNKTLAQKLFKIQDAQELKNPKIDSKIWVKQLYKVIKKLNNTKTEMIDMKPSEAIKLDQVTLHVKAVPNEDLLPADGLYRYLYQPGEL